MKKINWNAVHNSGKEYAPVSDDLINKIFKESTNTRTVLDMGCGKGDLLAKLAERQEIGELVGVDISKIALQKAKENLEEFISRVVLIEADFDDADFVSKFNGRTFDIIIINLSLAFVDNKDDFCNKVKELLSEGGIFTCRTPVLLEGEEYDDRQNRISISEDELENVLKKNFKEVLILEDDELDRPKWPLRTYLCK